MASRARWPGIPAILLPMLALSSPSWAGGSSSEPVGRRPSSPPHEPGLRARPQSGSFSSLEGWLAAAPGATSEISFKEVPVGDFIAGHYASTHSVSFDSLDKVRETSLFLVDRVGVDGQGPSQLTFSEPVWGVACEYPDGLRIEAYDADQALVFKSEDAGAAGVKGQFFGAIFPEPVKEVIIHDWVNHLVLYDTLYIAYDRADCADEDGDGVSTCDGDCDDAQATTLPGAEELLGDEVDNDCDGEIDEGACEACALSEGPANPDGASLDPQAGASAVLLHLRITNEGNERPLTVTRIEADVTWPQASEGDARLRLAEDAGCDGSVGAGGAAASGVHGAQAFTVSADVPAEGSRCYALVASWDGGGCPGCGVALATVTAGGITAESGGQPVALSGGPVSGALVLPGPALSLAEAPEEPVDPGAQVDISVSLDAPCPEAWEAEVSLCAAPDGAEGVDLGGEGEALTAAFDEAGQLSLPFTAGDRPGTYTLCFTPTKEGASCEGSEAFTVDVVVSGFTLLVSHDGDPTEVIGTFLSGISAPNVFEVQLFLPERDPRHLVRVGFDLDGVAVTATQSPFAAVYDMSLARVTSLLTVTVELSDGSIIEEVFDVFGLPVAEWVEEVLGASATVEQRFDPSAERYALSVRDFPAARFSLPVPADIPLLGGHPLDGTLSYDLDAGFHITRATDFTGEVSVVGHVAGQSYEVEGEISAAFDKELELLPGAHAKARAEVDVTLPRTVLRTEEVQVLGVPVRIETVVGGSARLRSASITTFDQRFRPEAMTLLPQVDAFVKVATSLEDQLGVADALATVRLCSALDAKLSHLSGPSVDAEHFGGVALVRVDVFGSLFWQEGEGAGQLAGATFGPFEFGDGTLTPGGSTLGKCAGGLVVPAFFPRAAIAADPGGGLLVVRTVDAAGPGEAPDPEIAFLMLGDGGFSAEARITDNALWEMDPDVTFLDGGEALAVWTSNRADRRVTSLDDVLSGQEIAFAHFDGEAWSSEALLTEDDAPDGMPQVAWSSFASQAIAVWVHHAPGARGGDPRIPSLRYRIFDGLQGTWGPAQDVPGTGDGSLILGPRVVAGLLGRFVVAWIRDGDGALSVDGEAVDGGDRVTVASDDTDLVFAVLGEEGWRAPVALTAPDSRVERSPTLAPRLDGRISVAWVSSGEDGDRLELSALDLDDEGDADAPRLLDRVDGFIRQPRLAVADGGETTVAFRKGDGARDDLFIAELPADAPFTRASAEPTVSQVTFDDGVSQDPALAMTAEGHLWLAWSRADRDEGDRGGLADLLSPGIRLAQLGERDRAAFTGERRLRERLGEGSLIEALDLDVSLDVRDRGTFSLQGRLFDRNGRALSDATFGPLELEPGGRSLTLSFDGREIREGGLTGPFHFGPLALLDHQASPVAIHGVTFEEETAPYDLSRFLPSRLDTGRDLFTGEDDALTMTVYEPAFAGQGAATVSVAGSTFDEPRAFDLPEVSPGRFSGEVRFSNDPTVEDAVFVEPAAVVRPTFTDANGREWSSPVSWVPPSPEPHALEVEVSPPRGGRLTFEGIDCPRDCFETVLFGQRVTLTAVPAEGYELLTFTGACTGSRECSFVMTEDSQVSARFREVEETPEPTAAPTPTEADPTPTPTAAPTDGPTPTEAPDEATDGGASPTPQPTQGGEGDEGCGCTSGAGRSPGRSPGLAFTLLLGMGWLGMRRRTRRP